MPAVSSRTRERALIRTLGDPGAQFSLASVQKRLGLVGGQQLTIDSAPGDGTRAQIAVPLPE